MSTRSSITAALALAAATILAVAACGSSVSGSAQPNPVAAETMTVPTTFDTSVPTELDATALPTDLDQLTSMLSDLPTDLGIPTDLAIPTDLTFPTDFTIPTDLGDLGDLNIPGLAPGCLAVSGALLSISVAVLPIYLGGTDAFNAGELQTALSSLSAQAPPELAADIQTLSDIAAQANGKSAAEVTTLLESPEYEAAFANIEAWTEANCGG